MSVQKCFCSLQLLPKHVVQANRNKANRVKSSLLLLCAITHIFRYWKESSQVTIRVNRFEISFSGSSLHHTYRIFYRVSLARFIDKLRKKQNDGVIMKPFHPVRIWKSQILQNLMKAIIPPSFKSLSCLDQILKNWVSKLAYFVEPDKAISSPSFIALGYLHQIFYGRRVEPPLQCYNEIRKPSAYRVNRSFVQVARF